MLPRSALRGLRAGASRAQAAAPYTRQSSTVSTNAQLARAHSTRVPLRPTTRSSIATAWPASSTAWAHAALVFRGLHASRAAGRPLGADTEKSLRELGDKFGEARLEIEDARESGIICAI